MSTFPVEDPPGSGNYRASREQPATTDREALKTALEALLRMEVTLNAILAYLAAEADAKAISRMRIIP